jgi:hypothetical protein
MTTNQQPEDQLPAQELPCVTCAVGGPAFRKMASDVREIKLALVGDPEYGHRGLVQRVDAIERTQAEHDRKIYLWSGLAAAAGMVLTFFKDKLLK